MGLEHKRFRNKRKTDRTFSKRKTVLALVFCVYIFLLLEGSARIFVAIPSLFQTISKGAGCDAIWRIWWVKRHQKRNVDVFFSFDLYHPRRGWSLKPNVRGLEVFPGMTLNTNSKGVRGIVEFPYARTWKAPRILVLGDSFTFGDEVNDYETYPYFLQQLLPHSEVINFGVHGYGHDQMLLYYLEEGKKYAPDIVILGFYSGDMDRNMLSFRDYAKPRFALEGSQLFLANTPVPPPQTMHTEIWQLKIVDLWNILYSNFERKSGQYQSRRAKISYAILEELVKNIRQSGAVPLFAYLSGVRQKGNNHGMNRMEKQFFEKWKKKGVHCVLLRPRVQSARKNGVLLKETGHFGPKTNEIIAEGLKEYLSKNHLLLGGNQPKTHVTHQRKGPQD